jgi:hypothetical protein
MTKRRVKPKPQPVKAPPVDAVAAALVQRGESLRMPWGVDTLERIEDYEGVLCCVFGFGNVWRWIFRSGRRVIVTKCDQVVRT